MNRDPDPSPDIMQRLEEMAEISESPDHLTRRCLTPEHRRINDLVARWMRDAGMEVREDAFANVIGRYEGTSPGRPAILLGSHVDTVIMAGKYDGPLGILAAIDCVRSLDRRGIRFANPIEVVGFADEEGVRFQSTYLGSRAMAGKFEVDMLNRPDHQGITLSEAMRQFGLDPNRIGEAARRPEDLVCYIEVHIEQGPVLESEDRPAAAVTAITGANRMTVTIKGEAGHAGTVPMGARKDALLAASECILAVEAIAARNPEAVGTVGEIDVSPGATNVIPGKVAFSVDVRAADDDVRSAMVAELIDEMNRIVAGRTVGLSISSTHDAGSVACAPWLIGEIETAMTELDLEPRRLPSGAGHDAAAMSAITDVGMIFIRCAGGISHNPAESITEDDARLATRLLLQTVENIATGLQSEQPVAQ